MKLLYIIAADAIALADAAPEVDQHPADSDHPCDDCGHLDEGCSRKHEMRCLGWVPKPVRPAVSESEASDVVCDACGAKAHIFEGTPCAVCHEGFMRKPAPVQSAPSEERVEKALCWFNGLDPKINPEASYGLALAAEVKHLRAQLAEWERIKGLFRDEAKYRSDSRNPYGSHGHSIAGIWDGDNGPLAGHECAACAAARTALDGKETVGNLTSDEIRCRYCGARVEIRDNQPADPASAPTMCWPECTRCGMTGPGFNADEGGEAQAIKWARDGGDLIHTDCAALDGKES